MAGHSEIGLFATLAIAAPKRDKKGELFGSPSICVRAPETAPLENEFRSDLY